MNRKILIGDYAKQREWNEKPGIYESIEEWFCAATCVAGFWFAVWVLWQLWRWAA